MSNRNVHIQGGLLTGIFWIVTRIIFWVILGGVLAQVITILFLIIFGEQREFAWINSQMLGQLVDLHSMMTRVGIFAQPINSAIEAVQHLGEWICRGIYSLESINTETKNPLLVGFIGNSFAMASVITLQVTLLRMLNLFLILPMFFWVGLLGLIDGLVLRDLRTFSGGRESSLVYHRARSMALSSVLIGLFLYLILPLNMAPDLMLLPFVMAFGLLISIAARAFKKYV